MYWHFESLKLENKSPLLCKNLKSIYTFTLKSENLYCLILARLKWKSQHPHHELMSSKTLLTRLLPKTSLDIAALILCLFGWHRMYCIVQRCHCTGRVEHVRIQGGATTNSATSGDAPTVNAWLEARQTVPTNHLRLLAIVVVLCWTIPWQTN